MRQAVDPLSRAGRPGRGLVAGPHRPDTGPAYGAAARQLIALGHQRIVLIVREGFLKPVPGRCELAFLARRGIRVPGQVSLVPGDCDALLDRCQPRIAHMRWDNRLIVRRVVRWVDAVRKGRADRKSINIAAEFVPRRQHRAGVGSRRACLKIVTEYVESP